MSEVDTLTTAELEGRFADVLRNRGFLLLWLVQAFSQTGQNMTNFALLILVRNVIESNNLGQANTAIGLTVLSFSVPALLFSPIAGVVVERTNKRTVLVFTNALRGLAVLGFLFIQPDWRPLLALSMIYALTFASGAVGQFFGPALGAAIPMLVPKKDIVHANGLFNLTFTASQIAGFAALGPFLIKFVGVNTVLVGIVTTFFVCTLLSFVIPSTPPEQRALEDGTTSAFGQMLADVREGIVFIFQSSILVKSIGYLSVATASYLMVAVLGPDFVSGVLRLDSQDIAYLVGPAGIGIVLGGLLVGRVTRRLGAELTIEIGLTAAGAILIGLALLPVAAELLWQQSPQAERITIVLAALLAGTLGFANALVLAPSQSLLQSNSPDHIRARVYATFFTISNAVAFIPIVFAGAFADLFGVVKVLVALGALLFLIGVFQLEGRAGRAH